jgi:DnaJ-class molecular chaperone
MTADKRAERVHPNSVCRECEGEGMVLATETIHTDRSLTEQVVACPSCDGTGERKTR